LPKINLNRLPLFQRIIRHNGWHIIFSSSKTIKVWNKNNDYQPWKNYPAKKWKTCRAGYGNGTGAMAAFGYAGPMATVATSINGSAKTNVQTPIAAPSIRNVLKTFHFTVKISSTWNNNYTSKGWAKN
jgi:hypothetical protein